MTTACSIRRLKRKSHSLPGDSPSNRSSPSISNLQTLIVRYEKKKKKNVNISSTSLALCCTDPLIYFPTVKEFVRGKRKTGRENGCDVQCNLCKVDSGDREKAVRT